MGVEFLDEGERLIARPSGRMDADEGAAFAAAVEQRLQPGTKSVTIDLDRLDVLSLGAVRAILQLGRTLKGSQRTLDFAEGGAGVREALHQAGLNSFFAFTPPYEPHRGTSP